MDGLDHQQTGVQGQAVQADLVLNLGKEKNITAIIFKGNRAIFFHTSTAPSGSLTQQQQCLLSRSNQALEMEEEDEEEVEDSDVVCEGGARSWTFFFGCCCCIFGSWFVFCPLVLCCFKGWKKYYCSPRFDRFERHIICFFGLMRHVWCFVFFFAHAHTVSLCRRRMQKEGKTRKTRFALIRPAPLAQNIRHTLHFPCAFST